MPAPNRRPTNSPSQPRRAATKPHERPCNPHSLAPVSARMLPADPPAVNARSPRLALDRHAGVAHQATDRDRGQVLRVQLAAQPVDRRSEAGAVGHRDLYDLARMKRPELVVLAVELDGAGDKAPTGAVRHPPL